MPSLFRQSKNDNQKTRFLISGIVISFLALSYQNCGKMNKASIPVQSKEQKPAVLELDDSSKLILLGNGGGEFGSYAYDVNIATGEVTRTMYEVPTSDPVNVPVKLCLDEGKRALLESAYHNSSVCLFKKSEKDMVCTMEYISPYAIIKDHSNNTYKLGENAKACYDFYEICTENRTNFMNAVSAALVDIDDSVCN